MAAQKPPKRITRQRLRNVALAYVRRYGGSNARLRQVLERRVQRSLRFHGEQEREAEVATWIDELLGELQASGTCDDARQARQKAALLDGRPRRWIAQQLRSKGFEQAAVDEGLRTLEAGDDEPGADWVACCRFARRRGLGPFRRPGAAERPFQRQLAILMRAAFPYAMARRVLETQDPEELQAVIDAYAMTSRM